MAKNIEREIQASAGYIEYLEKRLRAHTEYIRRIESDLVHLRGDRLAGWVAASMLVVVLGVVLYQWLVVGTSCPSL